MDFEDRLIVINMGVFCLLEVNKIVEVLKIIKIRGSSFCRV